jgi:hypothetical protein
MAVLASRHELMLDDALCAAWYDLDARTPPPARRGRPVDDGVEWTGDQLHAGKAMPFVEGP